MKRGTFILLFVLTQSVMLFAQKKTVSGNVVDKNGNPIELATVRLKDNTAYTSTNASGAYSIAVSKGDTLYYSMLGYETQRKIVGKSDRMDVIMYESKDVTLADLVVTGYSKQERRDLTGAVSSVKLADDISFQSIDQMLQGKAPGVFMSTSSGALGSANVLTIRGISSIMGDNNPLYVIDGVPIYGTDRSSNSTDISGGAISATSMTGMQTGGGSLQYNTELKYSFEKNPLATLNPDDIESIEILKDAFATAIYGSRGASGVILITTKKGSKERPRININYTLGIDQPLGKLKLLNGKQYSQIYSNYFSGLNFPLGHDTDWLNAVTRTAVSHNVSASFSGGSQKTTYFLSLAASNNQSYVINNDMQRYSARLNLNTKLTPKLDLAVNVSISRLNNNALQAPEIYAAAIKKAPNLPIYDEDGKYHYGFAPNSKGDPETYNPVAQAYINDEGSEDTRVIGNTYLEWHPLSWLTWRTELGTDMYNVFSSIRKGDLPEHVKGVAGNQAQETTKLNLKYVITNTLNINKIIGNHFIQGVFGQSYEYVRDRINSVAGTNFFSPDLIGVGAAQSKRVISAYSVKSALFSAFARLNYQWKMKYMLGLTYRVDGSSRFNRNHRYLGTPSASIGWRLSNEQFFREAFPFINQAKLRSSFGLSSKDGNNSYYGAQATYKLNTLTTYGGLNYLQMSQPGNENLNWEHTFTWNAGLDVEALKSRLKLTLDYYYKKTTNMLFSSNLPLYTGYTKENQNIADMMNTGFDLQIISDNIISKNFQWQTIFNISSATNKILKLNFEGNQLDELNSSFKYYQEGKAAAQWYLHRWGGVDPESGNPLWVYADGTVSTVPPASQNATSQLNKFVYGTAMPTVYGSITNSFSYRNFELDIFFNYALGSHMMNSTRATLLTYTQEANNLSSEIMKLWQLPGQKTDIPKLKNTSIIGAYDYTTSITSSRFLENNSYLRLKTLTLAYRFPQTWLKRSKLCRQLRLYITATNLFTLTKYSGLDPEVSAFGSSATLSGYDNSTMPSSRSMQFGLSATF
ncbi:SusC/RagA family TonB-linked outer membrane protein [Segatella baroniae]|nr:SusC/RagA family TonB-linked outer membrane protein [Segatella baroniae]